MGPTPRASDSISLGWGLRIGTFNRFLLLLLLLLLLSHFSCVRLCVTP